VEGYNVRVGQFGMDLQFGDELEEEAKSAGNATVCAGMMSAPSELASRAPSWT